MAATAARLARLITPEYAARINAQLVHPAPSQVVKPNELESAIARPMHVSHYEPERPAKYLAATLSYGIIKAFFLGNVYLHAQGLPGLLDDISKREDLLLVADRYIGTAAGTLDVDKLAGVSDSQNSV
ncbi:hypothetical protein PYCCODRAFT_1473971 [Trametes coccinea BRFM310]|uniref:Uncharacterized protein n=1 Tax=Trametes coccinea (strain BRFM310) TaxID=1353009 RepID=A0A1Y2J204_TRAC3|nr:hypothetical protein PYCCODRAFT_1473971 [Trametes coccinea BRFM310]